jgi:polar amino acid transport system substrate-binding protein
MTGRVGALRWTAALGAVAVLAACQAGSGQPGPPVPQQSVVASPVGAAVDRTVPSGPASPPPTCDPRASLRPSGPLPPPGQVPSGATVARIYSRGKLIVGVDQNSYLIAYRDPATGKLVGFDIDIAKEIARAIFGNPEAVQLRAINAGDRIPMIKSGDVDIVVRQMTITCDRLQQVAFSTEYLTAGQRVLVNKGAGIRGIDDLGGKRVCAAKPSTNLDEIKAAPSHPIAVGVDTVIDCLVMLQQHQVEAVSSDDTVLAGLAAQDPNTEVVGAPFSDAPWGIAMKREAPDLVRYVNAVLASIKGNGTWRNIYPRWLSGLGPAPAPPADRYKD